MAIPIFTGGRIRADIEKAQADLVQRRAEYGDLEGRVKYDVRVAQLDRATSESSVEVAVANKSLAGRGLIKAGTLILELDPRDYAANVEHAAADLKTREADADSAQVNVPITDARVYSQLHSAEAARQEALASVGAEQANLLAAQHKVQQDDAISSRAERNRIRYKALVDKREISRSYYDAQETEAASAAEALASDRATETATRERISQLQSAVIERQAQIDSARTAPQQNVEARDLSQSAVGKRDEAKADLHTAALNLSYTKIYAPVDGVIGRKTVELGHRVQPGQSLLVVVPVDDIWVTAYYKESQLDWDSFMGVACEGSSHRL